MKQLLIASAALLALTATYAHGRAEACAGLKSGKAIVKPGNDTTRPYALIAGGSKGIGYAIAEALARRKFNLILIARGPDSLMAAKNRLESAYDINVHILSYDLANETSASEIRNWCTNNNIRLKILCNVAGFGGADDFLSLPLDSLRYMVNLNVESCLALSFELIPLLEKNPPAYILNVASMAGFAPIPVKNVYSATKSFIIFFSYALHFQLREQNISVSCLAPGPVFTKPSVVEDTKKHLGWLGMKMQVAPAKVGEIAVRKTLKRKIIIVPGTLAKISATVLRLLPKKMIVSMYDKRARKTQ